MMWIPMAIGAGVGALSSKEKQEQTKRMQEAEVEKMRYSNLTGMEGRMLTPAPSMLTGALQGAAMGAQVGNMGSMFGGGSAPQGPQSFAGTQGSGLQQAPQQNSWLNMQQNPLMMQQPQTMYS